MTLPAPNLDDRAFQDLVDEAKRLVQQRCPEWTDHNVADPGVTLIETFAFMVDQLIYRLNRVPDLNYIKFLELLGEKLRPPAAAITPVKFMLSVPQPNDVLIPEGTLLSTTRRGQEQPITFSTLGGLPLVTVTVTSLLTQDVGDTFVAQDQAVATRSEFEAFSAVPQVGDAFYIGLSRPAPNCIVRLSVSSRIEGIGVDPLRPPLVVEAWDGQSWYAVNILSDNTGGLNRDGNVELHIPRQAASNLAGTSAGWIRVRVTPITGDQPGYTSSPRISSLTAATIGGITSAAQCIPVLGEILGLTTGIPGQAMQLNRFPLVSGQSDLVLELSSPDGWQEWTRVEGFAQSGPDDRHFSIDEVSGQIRFGPIIRMADGKARKYGQTPNASLSVRVPRYLVGGGREGNVELGTLTVLRSSIPFVSRVENTEPAVGGVDGESIDELKARAAFSIRTRNRAVAPIDFEQLVQTAAPSLVRVQCIDATELGKPGVVLVLVIPEVPAGRFPFEVLQPRIEVLDDVQEYLDERRLIGTTLRIEPPLYLGVSVMVRMALKPGAARDRVVAAADAAIFGFLHPVSGGYDGSGWPFGRPIAVGDVYGLLQRVPGIAYVDRARVVAVDAISGARGEPGDQVQPGPLDLLFNVGNDIEILG